MRNLTAFLCGLFLGMTNFLWHLAYWVVISGLLAYIVYIKLH